MQDLKMYMFLFSEQEANSEESLKKRPKVDKSGDRVKWVKEITEQKAKIPWSVHSPGTLFFLFV